MKRSPDFFIVIPLTIALAAACGPSGPGPAQPTVTAKTEATSTGDQVAQDVTSPITTVVPTAPPVMATSSSSCPAPEGWSSYTVKAGDTLYTLAKQVNLTTEEVMRANCLNSSLISVGATLNLPLESCRPTPPEGWRLYTVRSGDTLFSLATNRDTTVDEVKRVNCLISDSLEVGKQLYLPPLALVHPTAVPPVAVPPPAPSPACSAFSCPPSANVPDLILAFVPPAPPPPSCLDKKTEPWIDASFLITTELKLGEQGYFYACDFPISPTTASMTLSDGSTESVEMVSRDVFYWLALPNQPMGVYTLTVTSSDGSLASVKFLVGPPARESIIPVPQAGPPGTIFQVYYVYFPLYSTPTFEFYRARQVITETQQGISKTVTIFSYLTQWQILITKPLPGTNDMGWAVHPLVSFTSDPEGSYVISFTNITGASIQLVR